jgi:hypothetical protein
MADPSNLPWFDNNLLSVRAERTNNPAATGCESLLPAGCSRPQDDSAVDEVART